MFLYLERPKLGLFDAYGSIRSTHLLCSPDGVFDYLRPEVSGFEASLNCASQERCLIASVIHSGKVPYNWQFAMLLQFPEQGWHRFLTSKWFNTNPGVGACGEPPRGAGIPNQVKYQHCSFWYACQVCARVWIQCFRSCLQ